MWSTKVTKNRTREKEIIHQLRGKTQKHKQSSYHVYNLIMFLQHQLLVRIKSCNRTETLLT